MTEPDRSAYPRPLLPTRRVRPAGAARARPVLGVALSAGLLLAGCTSGGGGTDPVSAPPLRLVAFESCDQAAASLRAAVMDHIGALAFPGADPRAGGPEAGDAAPAPPVAAREDATVLGSEAMPAAPAVPDVPGATVPHSGTNVHERGVDEPDLVKTDGRRIVTVTDGVLRVVDASRMVETARVHLWEHAGQGMLWQPADLLLHGDVALVLVASAWDAVVPLPAPVPAPDGRVAPGAEEAPGGAGPGGAVPPSEPVIVGPRLLLVGLGARPAVLAEYEVDGELVDARATGPVVRVVVRSGPRFAFPLVDPTADAERREAAYRKVVEAAGVDDWLPRYRLTTGSVTATGQVECTAVSHPDTYSGTSMLTVLTFDLSTGGLGDGDPVSVVADGDTVYSNGSSLYVASDRRWAAPARPDGGSPQARTDIYKFDISGPGRPRYVASGSVPGYLVNQYAMSEWDGHLRVAVTTGDGGETVSAVRVLAQRGSALVETGSVGGLGAGEQIYSVRFVGPVGYVVTFRRTDPLYTLDLSDPAAPRVRGELKITGYSSYLHPIDGDRLLGVGQEADLDGVVQGTQVSLFDVSDPAAPSVLDRHEIRYGYSEAEVDPHAFLWWEPARVVVLPVTVPTDAGFRAPPRSGVLVLRLEGDRFTEAGFVPHPADDPWSGNRIRRSLVIGDVLWTVSDLGLQANTLAGLGELAWLPHAGR
ncbi:MAG: beta-propeller domain-containing protein [Micromonosporaceae bacterium]